MQLEPNVLHGFEDYLLILAVDYYCSGPSGALIDHMQNGVAFMEE